MTTTYSSGPWARKPPKATVDMRLRAMASAWHAEMIIRSVN